MNNQGQLPYKKLPPDKRSKVIIAEIDAIFHQGNQNPDGVGYVDILRISDRVHQHFIDDPGGTPKQVSGAIDVAKGFCSPSALESVDLIRKGIGAIISTVGGLSLAWGIIFIIANGVFTTTGWLWWASRVLIFSGPLAIVGGIAALAGGLYLIAKKLTFRERAIKALEIIRKGLEEWGKEAKGEVDMSDYSWFLEMPKKECRATFCLAFFIANLDEKVVEEELQVIIRYVSLKPGVTDKAYSDGIAMSLDVAVQDLVHSKQKGKIIEFLTNICTSDGPITEDEEKALTEIKRKVKTA